MLVQSGLYRTWSEIPRAGFLTSRLIFVHSLSTVQIEIFRHNLNSGVQCCKAETEYRVGTNSALKNFMSQQLWTISFLANSVQVNSDPKKIGPSQCGPRLLVNLGPNHWSIRTFFIGQFGPQKEKFFGQFGPFLLVNSNVFHLSIRTFLVNSDLSIGQFGPLNYVNYV